MTILLFWDSGRLPARLLLFAFLVSTGCATRGRALQTYRLVERDTGQILIPPGVATADVGQRRFRTDIVTSGKPCAPASGVIAIRARRNGALVTVGREALLGQPPGWLSAWTAGIEDQGCLAPGEGLKLADRIAESLPLSPNAAFRLLHSSVADIDARTRLQVVSPILREGAAPDAPVLDPVTATGNGNSLTLAVRAAPNLIGYETSWYGARPKANQIGLVIVPLSAERNIGGEIERRPQPDTNYFQFPADAAFYRLFYKAEQTGFTALVIAARTRAELDQRAKKLETGIASCEKLNGELCITIPKLVAVNQLLAITVNGREVLARWGAPVGEAIRDAGERRPEVVLPDLKVYRMYNGRPAPVEFDRSSPAVLNLTLTGGEILSWK